MTTNLKDNNVYTIAAGLVALALCAPKTMHRDLVEEFANTENPTGINSKWTISHEEFADGQPNGCDCDQEPATRQHWLLHC
jgi:hypothetical protein